MSSRAEPYVFLSYGSINRVQALATADALEAAGVRVWVDRRSIPGGTAWSTEIARAIKHCAALIVLCSQRALASTNVHRELNLAVEEGKPLVPVLLERCPLPDEVRYALAGRQWVELLDRPQDAWLPDLLEAVQRVGSQAEATISPPTPGPPPVVAPAPAPGPSRPRHNLPAAVTSFIGRGPEVESVLRLLQSARLVTLTGPGGTGKTRLAVAVAEQILPRYPDGAWFVGLGAVSEPSLVPAGIAQVLGVQDSPHESLSATLQRHLREKQVLLIVDNFEQVLSAAPLLTALVAACSGLTLLVTSRVVLQISGEQEWPVPPLAVPEAWTDEAPEESVGEVPAVRLFVERAQAVQPAFRLTHAVAPAVAEICRRLDGLPLALELAAARIRLLPPPALLSRLERRLVLLTGGSRDLPARQQTLRNAIAWSYDLLTPPLQTLFRRLGIFAGGWTLDAVDAVCANESDLQLDTLDAMTALVTASLVVQDVDAAGEPRFRFLETVREYALEQLDASGERERHQRALAAYCVALSRDAGPRLLLPGRTPWQRRLLAEQENLRAAMAWIIERGEAASGLEVIASLWLWLYLARPVEGRHWAEAVLALPDAREVTHTRARALMGLAVLAWAQDDDATMRSALQESVALWRRLDNRSGLAESLAWAPFCWHDDPAAARRAGEESVALYRELGNRAGLAWALHPLSSFNMYTGEHDAAQAQAEESERIFADLGDRWLVSFPRTTLARLAEIRGNANTPWAELSQSILDRIAVSREHGDKHNLAGSLTELARRVRLHKQSDAMWSAAIREALSLRSEEGNRWSIAACLLEVAIRIGAAGRLVQAVQLESAAMAVRKSLSDSGLGSLIEIFAEAEEHLGSWRAELGERAFADAWGIGCKLTLDDAVALARGEAAMVVSPATPAGHDELDP